MRWHVITGEYPPQPGGVSDYTREVAHGLVAAGDQVEVWAPPCSQEIDSDQTVRVHRLPDRFGARSIAIMQKSLRLSSQTRVLVQYVPHAYGWKAMNVPLCVWLAARCRKSLSVMFHEVSYPIAREQSLRHNLLGVVTRSMALLLAAASQQVMVATPAWERLLRPALRGGANIQWSPVPSNIPVVAEPGSVEAIRSKFTTPGSSLVGHFGTYGPLVADSLIQIFPMVLSENREVPLLLLGRGGEAFRDDLVRVHPQLASRIHATGGLPSSDLSRHIAACDLFVQYYPDGVTCRRGSI
ncbi:MAG TPA: glycosyltransferase, partial [Candidatus Binatus sp.]|nr:glycosyltransferase [Candidatus Binatus sp.]